MASRTGFNKNNSAVKRIMQEARELANDPSTDYTAAPLEDDIFEWHCTLRGPPGTEFEGGLYHFRILLPTEYPFRPPSIMMLTPNGRFELNTKICISFTNYHEELWQPAWGVRTAIIGLQGFFPLRGTAAVGVGALEYPPTERKRLAALSRDWVCPRCNQTNLECLPDPRAVEAGSSALDAPHPEPTVTTLTPTPSTESASAIRSSNKETSANVHHLTPPNPSETTPACSSVPLFTPTPTRPGVPPSILKRHSGSSPARDSKSRALPETEPRSHFEQQEDLPILAAAISQTPHRPPVLLDTAICVVLVVTFALVVRRFF
ncbi:hypothetical protein AcV5_005925 [Taiwanofungus camphoratus]|nr:hypothetical protein AcV5_005925 [Antrodia cinnamomea]